MLSAYPWCPIVIKTKIFIAGFAFRLETISFTNFERFAKCLDTVSKWGEILPRGRLRESGRIFETGLSILSKIAVKTFFLRHTSQSIQNKATNYHIRNLQQNYLTLVFYKITVTIRCTINLCVSKKPICVTIAIAVFCDSFFFWTIIDSWFQHSDRKHFLGKLWVALSMKIQKLLVVPI